MTSLERAGRRSRGEVTGRSPPPDVLQPPATGSPTRASFARTQSDRAARLCTATGPRASCETCDGGTRLRENGEVLGQSCRDERRRAVLARAEEVARAAQAKVLLGDAEAVVGRLEHREALGRRALGAVHQHAQRRPRARGPRVRAVGGVGRARTARRARRRGRSRSRRRCRPRRRPSSRARRSRPGGTRRARRCARPPSSDRATSPMRRRGRARVHAACPAVASRSATVSDSSTSG